MKNRKFAGECSRTDEKNDGGRSNTRARLKFMVTTFERASNGRAANRARSRPPVAALAITYSNKRPIVIPRLIGVLDVSHDERRFRGPTGPIRRRKDGGTIDNEPDLDLPQDVSVLPSSECCQCMLARLRAPCTEFCGPYACATRWMA